MQRKFITNLAFLLFLNLLIKPFWILGIDRAVQNEVGAESYGLFSALFNFSFLFNIILDFGISNFNSRSIARNNQLLEKHLSVIISIRLLLGTIYFILSFSIAYLIGYRGDQLNLLWTLLLNQALLSFILYLRSNLAGLHLFKIDSLVSILDRTIMIIICGLLLWGGLTEQRFRIEWFIWSQTLAYGITAAITFFIVAGKAKWVRLRWKPAFFLVILKQSYPYALLILLMTFYNRIDSVMIERLLSDGAEQAGIYAQAFRILDAANMIAYLFSGLLLPMFAQMIKNKRPVEDLIELSSSLLAVPSVLVIIYGIFNSEEIMGLLYQSHISESSLVFKYMISCLFASGSVYIFGTLLTANGNLRQLNLIALLGMLLNIALNVILIPSLKSAGAAIAGLLTQFIMAGLQILLAHRIFNMEIRWSLVKRYLLLVFFTFATNWFFKDSSLHAALIVAITFSSGLAMALLLKIIRPIQLYRMYKKNEVF